MWQLGKLRPTKSPNKNQMQTLDNVDPVATVIQETKEVVCTYMYQLYNNEKTKQEFDATPSVPEFYNFTPDPFSAAAQVGRQLAKIGDDFNEKHADKFDQMIKDLKISQVSAYEAFAHVANKLFEDDINWGRILALLGFGYRIATKVLKLGERIHEFANVLMNVITNIVRFIGDAASGIASWIASQGGWIAAMSYVPQMETKYWVFFVIAAVSTIAAVLYFQK